MKTLFVALLAFPALAADPLAGREAALRWCAACHAVPGAPAPQTATDGVPSFAAVANDYAGRPDALKGFLAAPHEPMPPLELSTRQIDDIAAFILDPRRARP